ncbi:hypothetical protein RT99_13765 [Flavobacterium sp. MEB061]|uniref:hypothetical protein n=1 Tax=Flavobacterium sp. MEB061 TaxID=1587524 RepID=UPI0005AC6442|nr:hypothetical protein [Flavobacterium sp. MEB061]KIQ20150.1 hypothetical protein RT99_13765 [Flavobacterium sp. MEB061]
MKKTVLKNIASNLSNQIQKNNPFHLFCSIALLLILFSSCSSDNSAQEDAEAVNTTACKKRPGKIDFGRDNSEIIYNAQDKPIKIITTVFNPAGPKEPPMKRVYTIEYNAQGNAEKISKSIDNHEESQYKLEYNSSGKLIKQSQFNATGVLTAYTTAQYDGKGVLTGIITHNENTSADVTCEYQYENGILIKKSIQNLYDLDSQEYYNADYSYTYFLDKENKIKTYFEGPIGLLFISDLTNKQSLQYLADESSYQLFYARETSLENKMLKNIEIIAYRYNTRDTTKIDYSYDYDAEGFPTVQRVNYENTTRRYVSTPFGGSVFLVTPSNNYVLKSLNFSCN